jgi:hypothetical protein
MGEGPNTGSDDAAIEEADSQEDSADERSLAAPMKSFDVDWPRGLCILAPRETSRMTQQLETLLAALAEQQGTGRIDRRLQAEASAVLGKLHRLVREAKNEWSYSRKLCSS